MGFYKFLKVNQAGVMLIKGDQDPKGMSREEHERNTMIENLVWEAAKKIKPNSYINPQLIRKATADLIATFQEL